MKEKKIFDKMEKRMLKKQKKIERAAQSKKKTLEKHKDLARKR